MKKQFLYVLAGSLALTWAAPVLADGQAQDCKLIGSWIGYSGYDGTAWWMSTASGQNADHGTSVLQVPGFDPRLEIAPDVYAFPDAVASGFLQGVWKKTDGRNYAYSLLAIATNADGETLWLGKLAGTQTLLEGCDVMLLEQNTLSIFAPDADPFGDEPLFDPIPFPDHYGYRMHVDLP